MPQNLNSAQEYAQKWLDIIKKPEQPPEESWQVDYRTIHAKLCRVFQQGLA